MDVLRIEGPARLRGDVTVSGAKNAALPILAASLLADDVVRIDRVPRVTDVSNLASLLSALGMRVGWAGANRLCVATVDESPVSAPARIVRRMRASFCVLGPLLARRGRAVVPLPGGCNIGPRPVDIHLRGLAALGAEIRVSRGRVVARASRLRGTTLDLTGPRGSTVTGTANVLSAAVLAEGRSVLYGVATEPEVVDLANFLRAIGADITGQGTSTIVVHGVKRLSGADYEIVPDRIEAATFLLAAALTRGQIAVRGCVAEHLGAVLDLLESIGARLTREENAVTIDASGRLSAAQVETGPYPRLPTDVQAPLSALLATVAGRSRIRDGVFPKRFAHVRELNRFGARVWRVAGGINIEGVETLHGAAANACDLRAGAALALAALGADSASLLHGVAHLDRGYERFAEKLSGLGASIERVSRSKRANEVPALGFRPPAPAPIREVAAVA